MRYITLLLSLVLLTGCEAGVTTKIEVQGENESRISAKVEFRGEAAEEIKESAAVEAELLKLIQGRTGVKDPKRSVDDDYLSYEVELPYDKLQEASDVLGIASAQLDGTGEEVTLKLMLTRPDGLEKAIVAAAAEQPDSEALTRAMLGTTTVNVEVVYPGGVKEATGPAEVKVDGDRAVISQSIKEYQPGELTVVGDPTRSLLSIMLRPVLAVTGLLLLLWIVTLVQRRKRRSAEARPLPLT